LDEWLVSLRMERGMRAATDETLVS